MSASRRRNASSASRICLSPLRPSSKRNSSPICEQPASPLANETTAVEKSFVCQTSSQSRSKPSRGEETRLGGRLQISKIDRANLNRHQFRRKRWVLEAVKRTGHTAVPYRRPISYRVPYGSGQYGWVGQYGTGTDL